VTTTAHAPSTTTWPDLHVVPSGLRTALHARLARRLLESAAARIGVTISTADGAGQDGAGQDEAGQLVLHRPEEFYARLGRDGLIGFGEAYLNGAWDSPDLHQVLTRLATDLPTLVPQSMRRFRRAYAARMPRRHRNTVDQTRGNIAHHYDLSNGLFRLFLDETMTYSSGLFTGADQDLVSAQHRKIDRALDQACVGPGSRLLEIGTGWGELAIRAAARGAEVVTVTLSVEQQQLARERIARAGFADRVDVRLQDYRQVPTDQQYDAIVSVEMIEAVGEEFWPAYFQTIDRLLAPGGRAVIQAITMPHEQMVATRGGYTWINKYIFPGGFLPSVEAIDEVNRRHTTLRVRDRHLFGLDYAETLRRWDEAFLASRDQVLELGFDETFVRMWHFYLAYSRAGFASGYLDVGQFTLARPGLAQSGQR